MCTLTIIPYNHLQKVFIGFNRDELKNRKVAIPPAIYNNNNIQMIYPKDANFGGTWLGLNEYGYFFFLLNYNQKNLYLNYYINPSYKNKKSRGLIIPELLQLKSKIEILNYIKNLDYYNYSPFRLIFFDKNENNIFQFIYTGRGKKVRYFQIPFFQASSGLGDYKIYPLRKKHYKNFLKNPSIKKQIYFHNYIDSKNPESSIKINRKLSMTVSQTFILIKNKNIILHYYDLINQKKYKLNLSLKSTLSTYEY
ncbi:MAG: hypothetical protein KatS3mg129_2846 [Leptospiraceae bacterium]|nr:MAG: hypothetical protein KatS3mg129_2846 [Leptospiraceae bacterium]